MSESIIFKSQAFGGFNKEEVLNYIDKLNAGHSEELKNAEDSAAQLTEELNEERLHREESEKSFAELMTAYEELRQHYMMLKERSDNLESDNEKFRSRAESAEKELGIEKELNSQLEDKLEAMQQKMEKQAEENRRLALAANEMGDSARQILNGAKIGAENMLSDAKLSAESLNSEIDGFCADVEKTKAFMQDSLSVLVQRLEYIRNTADASRVKAEDQSGKIDQIREKYEKLVSEADSRAETFKKRFFQ